LKLKNDNQISLVNSILYGDKLCDHIDPFNGNVVYYYIFPQLVFCTIHFLFRNTQDPYSIHMNKYLWIVVILDSLYNLVSKNDFRSYFLNTGNDLILKNFYKICTFIIFVYFVYNFVIWPIGEKIKKTYNLNETPFEIFLNSIGFFNKSIVSIIQQMFKNQEIPQNVDEELAKFGEFTYKLFILVAILHTVYNIIFYFYVKDKREKKQSEINTIMKLKYNKQNNTFENLTAVQKEDMENLFFLKTYNLFKILLYLFKYKKC
jgi:hypothetical protein